MTFYAPVNSESPYLPISVKFESDPQVLVEQLTTMYNGISYRLNNRDISLYDFVELITGQKWTDPNNLQVPKEAYRTIYTVSAIGIGATLNIAHNTTVTTLTKIFGSVTTATDQRPLPYVDAAAVTNQVQVTVTATNIVIVNGATAPAITGGIVGIEYLKN